MSFAVTGRLAQVVTPHAPRLPRGGASCSSVQGFASGFLPTYLAVRRLPLAGNQHHLFFQRTSTSQRLFMTGAPVGTRIAPRPPAQIPASGTTALGSYLG